MIMESSSLYLNSKQGHAMPQWITVNQELFSDRNISLILELPLNRKNKIQKYIHSYYIMHKIRMREITEILQICPKNASNLSGLQYGRNVL